MRVYFTRLLDPERWDGMAPNAVWYSSTLAGSGDRRGGWWMEGEDGAINLALARRSPDAIQVTNAEEALSPMFLWRLAVDAERREGGKPSALELLTGRPDVGAVPR